MPALVGCLHRDAEALVSTLTGSRRTMACYGLRYSTPEVSDSPIAAALFSILDGDPLESSVAFARALKEPERPPADLARRALVGLGPRAAAAVPELMRKLEGADGPTWDWVSAVLASIGPPARPALPLIVERLRKAEPGSVLLAHRAASIALAADVPMLLPLLRSAEPSVRRAALWALERMGQKAAAAVPALEACLHDADDEVQNLAWMALTSVRQGLAP